MPAGTISPTPVISVLVPTYCRPLALRRCIASLACQDFPREFELIVTDDGSDPPAASSLSGGPASGVDLVLLSQPNQGAGAARASGIRRARGEILAFLDDDCTVPSDYLRSIENVFTRYPETMIVQVGLENPQPKNIYGQAWKFALEQTLKSNLHPDENGRLTCGILGGVMVARRELFEYAGYDPRFTKGREDADFRYQLQKLNIPVYYEPNIKVFHHYRQSLHSYLASFFAYGRGEFHLQHKWRENPSPVKYPKLTSWRALKSLVRAEGLVQGFVIYCLLWLKRHAGLWGVLYETAASKRPGCRARTVGRFASLLLSRYVLRTGWLLIVPLKRRLSNLLLSDRLRL